MKKYKLINTKTNEEHLCDKVTIDGFEYYVSDKQPVKGWYYDSYINKIKNTNGAEYVENEITKQIIACNSPNIDIPKVVDEVEIICIKDLQDFYGSDIQLTSEGENYLSGFKTGYNKSQETHPFSEEDMIEFAQWLRQEDTEENAEKYANFTDADMLKLWKKQQPITVRVLPKAGI